MPRAYVCMCRAIVAHNVHALIVIRIVCIIGERSSESTNVNDSSYQEAAYIRGCIIISGVKGQSECMHIECDITRAFDSE